MSLVEIEFINTDSIKKESVGVDRNFLTPEQCNEDDKRKIKNELESSKMKYEEYGQILISEQNIKALLFVCKFCKEECKTFKQFISHVKRNHLHMKRKNKNKEETIFKNLIDTGQKPVEAPPVPKSSINEKQQEEFMNIIKVENLISMDSSVPIYNDSDRKFDYEEIECVSENHTKPETKSLKEVYSTTCTYCKKDCRSNRERIVHERIHTGEKPFKCDLCDKLFRTKYLKQLHLNTHTGNRPYKCSHCDAAFSHQMNLTCHIRAIHTFEKRFECELCGKRFVRNVELRIHFRSHTGEKPYQCHECGACFSISSKLTEHKKRHTNTRPYKCPICNLCFYNNANLKNHSVVHSQEKPFACDVCDAKFPRKRALVSHKKIHLQVGEYVCKICGKKFKQNPGLYCHMKSHGKAFTSTYRTNE